MGNSEIELILADRSQEGRRVKEKWIFEIFERA